jgi:hypothetical protein
MASWKPISRPFRNRSPRILSLKEIGSEQMCQSPIMSSLCPGPRLPTKIIAGSDDDTRCRWCKRAPNATKPPPVDVARKREAIHSEEDLKPKSSTRVEIARNRVNNAADALAQRKPKEAGIVLGNNWSRFAEVFLIDVFEKMCESQPPGPFALVVAGSLSRRQATP